jgi:hypothetical protein
MSVYDFPAFDARNPLDFGMRVVVPGALAEEIETEGILHINDLGEPEVVSVDSVEVPLTVLKLSATAINKYSNDTDH